MPSQAIKHFYTVCVKITHTRTQQKLMKSYKYTSTYTKKNNGQPLHTYTYTINYNVKPIFGRKGKKLTHILIGS